MPWGFAIGALGAVAGAYISGNAAQSAAQTQANAANQASATELQMYDENVARLAPWVTAGEGALTNLQGLVGTNGANGLATTPFSAQQYQQSPGYAWQMQQGTQAIADQASATGGVNSGNTLKSLQTFGQGLANSDYQQALQNYTNWQQQIYGMTSGIAQSGENAAGQTAGLGASVAGQIGGNIIGAGNARAAGQVGVANAINGGLGNLSSLAMYRMMQQRGAGGYAGGAGYGFGQSGAGAGINPFGLYGG